MRDRPVLDAAVERALRAAALSTEVKYNLWRNALTLSSDQQQRRVIAQAIAQGIAIEAQILLLDEPTSALDPIATLLTTLKQHFTLILVTHNMQQAARVSDYSAFMHQGAVVKFGLTDTLFSAPRQRRTKE